MKHFCVSIRARRPRREDGGRACCPQKSRQAGNDFFSQADPGYSPACGRALPFRRTVIAAVLFHLFLSGTSNSAHPERHGITVFLGQSEIADFDQPITRVAIADPDIADATVISPHQIMVDGKKTGVTSLVVWPESGNYQKFRISVRAEASPYQVMLNVRFMEINKNALKEFGSDFLVKGMRAGSERVDMGLFGGKVGVPADPLELGNTVDLFFAIPTSRFTSILKALQENNLLSVLAAPNVSAISGAEAAFLAGGEFPIPIVSGAGGMQTLTIQFKEYGVKLRFVPTVLDTGLVNIRVMAEVSHLDFENGVELSGFRIPSLVTRKAETTVELECGRHLILGGLLSNEMSQVVSKIPVLGSIPVLGRLFSSTRYQNKETELLVTLSPQVVETLSDGGAPELNLKRPDHNGGN
ncbi:pilus assembly protein N-terminal domain-containing protein [bacterium]|nr:pilus assembly protein N-terminal domain-containing protein [bacterium]